MSAFNPRQMFILDEACKPIMKEYARLVDVAGPQLVAFLGLAIGEYLAARTGMPIDFQVQQQTAPNAHHSGSRNPLGLRTLDNYRGDAAPETSHPTD